MIMAKFIRPASRLVMLAALFFMAGCGCEKQRPVPSPDLPTVPASRLKEPAFKAEMKRRVAAQNEVAARKAELEERMEAIRRRAAAPESDPEWKNLQAAHAACVAELKEQLKRTRGAVRAAQVQDAADKAAVRAGKAVVEPVAKK